MNFPFDPNTDLGNVVTLGVKQAPKQFEGDPSPEKLSMEFRPANLHFLPFAKGQCGHINVIVCEDMLEVRCADCDTLLNPIWVLARLARAETKWSYERDKIIAMRKALDARTRTKCNHCGKMTAIKV